MPVVKIMTRAVDGAACQGFCGLAALADSNAFFMRFL